jgi:hypothetical protein
MPHFQLDSFLGDMDIVMAMGTSALEGAKIGKPTILLDPTLKKVSGDYVFRMLHNTLEYDLGHFITKNDFVRNNTSLKDILVNIIENYDSVSKDSSAYFFANHHLERVKDLFINKVSSSSLTFSMLKADLFEKPWLLKVYNKFRGLKS